MITSNKSQGIVKGALILGFAMFVSKLIGFLYRIPMTAILGDTGNAIYGVAFNIYIVLLGISAIGIPGAISKLIAECLAKNSPSDAKRVFRVALFYTGLLSSLSSIGLFVSAEWIAVELNNMKDLVLPLRILAPTIFIASISAVVRGYFQGMNTMFPTALSQITEQLANAIFSVVLGYYFLQYGIAVAAAGSTMGTGIGALCGLLVMLLLYKRLPKDAISTTSSDSFNLENTLPPAPLFNSRREIIYKLLSTIIPMVLTTSVFSIFSVIDSSMLAHNLPEALAFLRQQDLLHTVPVSNIFELTNLEIATSLIGQYTTKYFTLINIPISLILIVSVSAIPSISSSYALGKMDELTDKIHKILRIGFMLGIPAAFGMMIFANEIMALMFSAYPDGGSLVMHGALTIIFITSAQLCSSILQGMGKQYIPALFAGITLVVKVILNIILLGIPSLHIYSVIYSTLIAYMLFALLNILYLKYKLGLTLPIRMLYLKPLLGSLVMSGLGLIFFNVLNYFSTFTHLNLMMSILFCILIYGLSCLKLGAFDSTDLSSFHKILNKIKPKHSSKS